GIGKHTLTTRAYCTGFAERTVLEIARLTVRRRRNARPLVLRRFEPFAEAAAAAELDAARHDAASRVGRAVAHRHALLLRDRTDHAVELVAAVALRACIAGGGRGAALAAAANEIASTRRVRAARGPGSAEGRALPAGAREPVLAVVGEPALCAGRRALR